LESLRRKSNLCFIYIDRYWIQTWRRLTIERLWLLRTTGLIMHMYIELNNVQHLSKLPLIKCQKPKLGMWNYQYKILPMEK
jgi:hypothetical protein